ncbi:YrdB family protein [Promicromonospora sp. NPDC019610]|uniref:YrdB family protein n=1 Tax=Promicromonospora sp. NPDC019610 TaxID=3364405 RepID=UPI0037AE615C
MRTTALVVRFLLELALAAGAGYAAWNLADGAWRVAAVLLAPAVVIALWASFLSPKAPVSIPAWAQVVLEAALFGGVGYLCWRAGASSAGVALAAVWAVDRLVLWLTRNQRSVLEPERDPGPRRAS